MNQSLIKNGGNYFDLKDLFAQNNTSFEFYATEHFRLSGVYWGLTALYLMGTEDSLDRIDLINWVIACKK